MAIPDEKYQNSPTGGQAFPDGGGVKPPSVPPPPVAPRLSLPPCMQRGKNICV